MICPKCGKNMTNTTETKAYCMNCDVLVHIPTGIPYTGRAKEDEFIGCPGALLKEDRKDFAATLAPDTLLMTWNEGEESRIEKVPYQTITALDIGQRKQSEVTSLESAAGAAMLGLAMGGLSVLEQALTNVKTLKIKTAQKEYEIWIPQAPKWADRIRDQMTTSHTQSEGALRFASRAEPARTSDKAQPAPSTKFCRECGVKVPRDSRYCEECGSELTDTAPAETPRESTPPETGVGSEVWEENRLREIRELREKEREKAAEYKQMKEAGLLPDTPALSKLVAAASKVHVSYERGVLIGRVIKIVGVLLIILGAIVGLNEVMYMMTGHGFLPFLTP